MRNKTLYGLVLLATFMSLGHHVDHVLRGNHTGWPLTPEPTPFTYSFGFYPLIAVGLYLYKKERVGAGFWAVLSAVGILFVGLTHFGPLAAEPPADILSPYESAIAGWLALSWLVAFLLILGTITIYGTYVWAHEPREQPDN